LAGGLGDCADAPVETDSESAKEAPRTAPAMIPRLELRRVKVNVRIV
jgi:hypothetical protein